MKNSTAKKITVAAAPVPKIHPELLEEPTKGPATAVQKKKRPKAKKKPAKKPVVKVAVEKKATPSRAMRMRLLSARAADSVIDQVKIAFSVSAIGLMIGLILGASVPLTTYFISHYEWKEVWSIYSLLVAGGLIFSANSVYFWTKAAFRSGIKALGFVILTELGMIFSHIAWINLLGLSILIGINAIASGANLVLKPQVKKKLSWEN